jgi:hypothetical protein
VDVDVYAGCVMWMCDVCVMWMCDVDVYAGSHDVVFLQDVVERVEECMQDTG